MNYFVEFAQTIILHQSNIYILLVSILFLIQFLIARKHIYSIFDPLLFFVVFNSFGWAVPYFIKNDHTLSYFIDITIFNILFLIPALFIKPINREKCKTTFFNRLRKVDYQFYYVIFIIMALSTIFLWGVRGIPLLSDNPDRAKVLLYSGGFGFVRYIHFVVPSYCCFYALLSVVHDRKGSLTNFLNIIIFSFSILVLLSTGSKSSLLPIVFIFGYISYLNPNNSRSKVLKKLTYLLLILVFIVLILVFSLVAKSTDLGLIYKLFLIRMIAFGDALFFWYSYGLSEKMESINIIFYLLSPLLAIFRVIEQQAPLGAMLVTEATGQDIVSFGPNGQLPIVLDLAFGPFKYMFSLFFGIIYFFLRSRLHAIVSKFASLGILNFTILFFSLSYIYTDVLLVLSKLYSALVLFLLFYIFTNLLQKRV